MSADEAPASAWIGNSSRVCGGADIADLNCELIRWTASSSPDSNRARLGPRTAALVALLEGNGAKVTTSIIRDEPGWHFTQNPAWECPELVHETCRWADALD